MNKVVVDRLHNVFKSTINEGVVLKELSQILH